MDCVGLEIRPEFPGGSDEGESKFLYVWIASFWIRKSSTTILDWEFVIMGMACECRTDGSGRNSQIHVKHLAGDWLR